VRALGVPSRLVFWRSPEDQPGWARPALLAVAAVAAVLYAWRIRDSGFAMFYSVAAKSMSVSWKAFFYGALDPGATITIDKLAGSFAPQAIAARVFGYHAWSLTLPQVVEGVVAVLVMYRIGRRFAGPAAGLLAAGLFGLTPVVASMFGHPMEDGLLTMCLVLAADAFQRAMLEGRLRSLLLAGVWVGVGFQAKMLQAWMVLPAMAVTYLVAAPGPWRRRLGHLGAAGAVMLAVSLSWVALYELTPDADRPYVDGSTNNSAIAMVFGYNGLDRFGVHVPGAVESMFTGGRPGRLEALVGVPGGPAAGADLPGVARAGGGPGGEGAAKLVGPRYGSQVGWLYPVALLGLLFGVAARGRAPRTDPVRANHLFWGLWLVTVAVVFSAIRIPHTAYLASLAPPVAALSAAAVVQAWRGLRDRDAPWLLPALVVAEAAWTVYLARQFPAFLPWLPWAASAAALVALPVLVAAALRRAPEPRRAVLRSAMGLAVAAMVAAPSAWAASVLHSRYGGSAFDASAGPTAMEGPGGGRFPAQGGFLPPRGQIPGGQIPGGQFPGGQAPGGPGGGAPVPMAQQFGGPGGGPFAEATGTLTPERRRIDDYLVAHRGGARFVAATTSWSTAAPYIMATGRPYLPMGGFSGDVPQPTLAAVQGLVARGELRYFLLPVSGAGPDLAFGRAGGTAAVTEIADWVRASCAETGVGAATESVYRCGR